MPIVSSESSLKRHAGFFADQHKRHFFLPSQAPHCRCGWAAAYRVVLRAQDNCAASQGDNLSREQSGRRRGEADARFKLL
jgi:hypothetical protein